MPFQGLRHRYAPRGQLWMSARDSVFSWLLTLLCSLLSWPREHFPFSPRSWLGCPVCSQATKNEQQQEHHWERQLGNQPMELRGDFLPTEWRLPTQGSYSPLPERGPWHLVSLRLSFTFLSFLPLSFLHFLCILPYLSPHYLTTLLNTM